MQYQDGSEVRVGDRVQFINGDTGSIVASFDRREFSSQYPENEWGHETTGVLVRTDKGALVHVADQPGLLHRLIS